MGNLFSKNEADDGKGSPNEEDIKSDSSESLPNEPSPAQPPSPDVPNSNVARAYSGAGNPFQTALSSFNNKAQLVFMRARDAVRDAVSKMKELGFIGIAKRAGKWMHEHPWETAAIIVFVVFMASTPAILAAMGFTTAGIAAGSTAAAMQSGIGSVVAGSAFAICQSAMTAGYGAFIFALPLLPAAAVYVYGLVCQWWNGTGGGGVDGGGEGGPGGGGNGNSGHDGEDEGCGSTNAAITNETAIMHLDSDPKVTVQELATDLVQVVQLGAIFVAANVVHRYRRWRQN